MLFGLIVKNNFRSSCFSLFFNLLNFIWLLSFCYLFFNLIYSLFPLFSLILLLFFSKMWRIDLYFRCLMLIPNNKLLCIFSSFSHHLYYHKLLHCLGKSWTILYDIFQRFMWSIWSHQIDHCTHIIQLSSALVIIIFIKRKSCLKHFPSTLRRPISNHNHLSILFCDSHRFF